eukprot:gene7219-11535_t
MSAFKLQFPGSLREAKLFYSDACAILMGFMLIWIGISSALGHIIMIFNFFRYTTVVGWVTAAFYIITGVFSIASGLVPFNPVQLVLTVIVGALFIFSVLAQLFAYQFDFVIAGAVLFFPFHYGQGVFFDGELKSV